MLPLSWVWSINLLYGVLVNFIMRTLIAFKIVTYFFSFLSPGKWSKSSFCLWVILIIPYRHVYVSFSRIEGFEGGRREERYYAFVILLSFLFTLVLSVVFNSIAQWKVGSSLLIAILQIIFLPLFSLSHFTLCERIFFICSWMHSLRSPTSREAPGSRNPVCLAPCMDLLCEFCSTATTVLVRFPKPTATASIWWHLLQDSLKLRELFFSPYSPIFNSSAPLKASTPYFVASMESFALDFSCGLTFSWKCLNSIFHECFLFLYYILWDLFSRLTCSVQFLMTLYVQL